MRVRVDGSTGRRQPATRAAIASPTSEVRRVAPGCALGEVGDRRPPRRRRPRRRSPRWSSSSEAERIAAVGSAFCWPAMSGAEPCTGSNMRGRGAVGVDVAGGREADAAGDGGGEVGDDVAEEVVGDDHVEARRVGGHEDHRRVDVHVVGGDVGELRGDLLEQPPPDRAGVDQHVGLVDQRELLARAALGAGERVADDPLDAERGVDRDLGGDLVRACRRAARRRCRCRGPRCPRGRRRSRPRRGRPAARARPGRSGTGAG